MPTQIEDKDAIRELMAAYCHRSDSGDAEGVGALFTEDCIWDGGPFGRKHGPEELIEFVRAGASSGASGARHITANEIISVDGDHATASCYFLVVRSDEGRPVPMFVGYYDDRFVKRDGRWLFKERITRM